MAMMWHDSSIGDSSTDRLLLFSGKFHMHVQPSAFVEIVHLALYDCNKIVGGWTHMAWPRVGGKNVCSESACLCSRSKPPPYLYAKMFGHITVQSARYYRWWFRASPCSRHKHGGGIRKRNSQWNVAVALHQEISLAKTTDKCCSLHLNRFLCNGKLRSSMALWFQVRWLMTDKHSNISWRRRAWFLEASELERNQMRNPSLHRL